MAGNRKQAKKTAKRARKQKQTDRKHLRKMRKFAYNKKMRAKAASGEKKKAERK